MSCFPQSNLSISQLDDIILFSDEYLTDDFMITGKIEDMESNYDHFQIQEIPVANEIHHQNYYEHANVNNNIKYSEKRPIKPKSIVASVVIPTTKAVVSKPKKRTSSSLNQSFKDDNIEEKRLQLSRKEFIRSLFPTDLRYSYGRIIVDAFNTANANHLNNALKSFCIPDCVTKEYFHGSQNPYGPNYRELGGVESIGYYWNIISSAMPDAVFTIMDVKVKLLSSMPENFGGYAESMKNESNDTSSEGSCEQLPYSYSSDGLVFIVKYTLTGTKLYEVVTEQLKRVSNHTTIVHSSGKQRLVYGPVTPEYGSSKIYLSPLSTEEPVMKIRPDMKITGYWFIVLNSDSKIKKFEFHYHNPNEL